MMQIRELFFPSLCHRCLKKEKKFLCDNCILGIEFAECIGGDTAQVFDVGADFLLQKRKKYQEIIISCTVIQLHRLKWRFGRIESEPELIYLKKVLEGKFELEGYKPLYLISRSVNPILLEPMKKDRFVLLI